MNYFGRNSRLAGAALIATLLLGVPGHARGSEPTSTATVTDSNGKAYRIVNLSAKYVPGGTWLGTRPDRIESSLLLSLFATRDRVTTEEKIELVFEKIRRIVLKNAERAVERQPAPKGVAAKPIRVELRDGSVKLLGQKALTTLGADGKQASNTEFDSYSLKAGEAQGQSVMLSGFVGRARTSDGKEGDFWIPLAETATIEFE